MMQILSWLEEAGHFIYFAARTFLASFTWPARFRETIAQLGHVLLGALPLGIMAGVALGIVVWMHLRGALVEVAGPGALSYLPQGLALAVVLEFGPMSAGLLVAGRTGASLGAELGSMRHTEQLDALVMLGISPLSKLIVPRTVGCMLALPLLTIFIDYLALGSAYFAELLGGSMTFTQFSRDCLRVLTLHQVVPATLKTLVFGFLIGVTGCWFGLRAEGGTTGVGRAATRGVVGSTLLVLASDVLLVRLIQVYVSP